MNKTDKWWKKSVVYQIYPQSFKDSNGDGYGDIRGIIEKLDYIRDLGADVIWLNPIYESPLIDNGYDISDYTKINPLYGTNEDFKELLNEAHSRGIKVILDLAVNHTSNQHPWFIESKKSKDNKYADYYIWKDPKEDGSAPTNWGASFGGPAWDYVKERDQYYLHCFAKEMPDLNWDNRQVRQEVYNIMRYWLDLGLDGFRMDTISLFSKDPSFPDAAPGARYTKSYYIGVSNGPNIHKYLREMNEEVLSRYDIMIVGETPNTSVEQALLYTDPRRREIDMIFQFDHMHLDYGRHGKFSDVRFKLSDLKEALSKWQYGLEEGWNSLYWSNHDQPRAVTRFGNEKEKYRKVSAKMLGTLLHMMKGTPFIYQGEEIGMKNTDYNLEDYKDIETLNEIDQMRQAGEEESYIKRTCYLKSRDNARTPMPWSDKEGFGFSEVDPWIKHSPDNKSINVQSALDDNTSVFYHYKKLIDLRKNYDVIVDGKYELICKDDSDIFAYTRSLNDDLLLVINSFSENKVNFEVPEDFHCRKWSLLISNYSKGRSFEKRFVLEPYESLVFYSKDSRI